MMLLTLRGTPSLYYGDEIGMRDVPIPPARVRDPFERNVPGLGLGRDPERTPMQWEATAGAGFTTGEPWLPLAADADALNVAAQRDDARSMLALHRRLLALRRAEPALHAGPYAPLRTTGDLLAWVRKHEDRRFLVVLNLGHEAASYTPPVLALDATVAISTHLDRDGEQVRGTVDLRGDEGVVLRLR
jgi:alpha-glucosidase